MRQADHGLNGLEISAWQLRLLLGTLHGGVGLLLQRLTAILCARLLRVGLERSRRASE